MVAYASRPSAFSDSVFEPLRLKFAVVSESDGTTAANTLYQAGVDPIGVAAANAVGGMALVEGDVNFTGGVVPANIGYELHSLAANVWVLDHSAIPTELILHTLANSCWLKMVYAGQPYDLGLLSDYLGPVGPATGANGKVFAKRFGWDHAERDYAIRLYPQQSFKIEAKILRALSGLVASKRYVVNLTFGCRKMTADEAAVKQ